MTAVVVYRPSEYSKAILGAVRKYFHLEKVDMGGFGAVELVETENSSIYFVPLTKSYELNVEEMEKKILSSMGANVVVSINKHTADIREGIFIHSAGNTTGENIMGGGYTPKSLAKTDPGTMGMIVRAVHMFANELGVPPVINIEATHDFPVRTRIPYISFEVRGEYYDLSALALVESLGRGARFKPYLSIGRSYYANEFVPRILQKRKFPAYHVPAYLAHHLSRDFLLELKREGHIRGVAYGRGVDREKLPF